MAIERPIQWEVQRDIQWRHLTDHCYARVTIVDVPLAASRVPCLLCGFTSLPQNDYSRLPACSFPCALASTWFYVLVSE